jgi:cell division protein FtsW
VARRTAAAPRRGRKSSRRAPATRPLEYRILLTATLCLLATGAVMVYSASSARDLLAGHGDGSAFLTRYVIYGALGIVLMHLLARGGLDGVRRATPLLVALAFIGVLATFLPGIGVSINGARRWIGAGSLQFQPAELMKLALVLYAARLIAARPRRLKSLKQMCTPLMVVVAAACMLVAAQPDLGTALVIGLAVCALLVAGGVPLRNLALLAGIGVVLVAMFALIEPYRRARLTSFLNPWAHAGTSGFQAVQGQIALGSGGLLGVGLGQSVQKVFYLPEAHTDFILAVIGEELGLAGICGVLFLYGMIAYAGLRAAKAAVGNYAKLVAAGVTALILCQATLNVFAVLGLAPLTGVPLPFISYGSSSLVVLLSAMGLLLNVAGRSSARVRAVPTPSRRTGKVVKKSSRDATQDRDRRRRDRRARGAGAGRRRRASG